MEHETQRHRIEREVHEDLTKKSDEHLLADIHDESVNANRSEAPITRTLARFASLLVVLARKSDEAAKRGENLQSRIERYTVILLVLTGVLAVVAFAQIVASAIQIYLMLHPPK
jgi:hypothetical protein